MKKFLSELSLASAVAVNNSIVVAANQRYRDEDNYKKEIINLISMFDAFYKAPGNENINKIAEVITGEITYNHLVDISDIMTTCHTVYSDALLCGIIKTSFETDEEILCKAKTYENVKLVGLHSDRETTEFDIAYISVMLCTWLALGAGGVLIKNYAEILENQVSFFTRFRRFGNISAETKMKMADFFKNLSVELDQYSKMLEKQNLENLEKLDEI